MLKTRRNISPPRNNNNYPNWPKYIERVVLQRELLARFVLLQQA